MKRFLLPALVCAVAVTFVGCCCCVSPKPKDPTNYIQINDGPKQAIKSEAFAFWEDAYYRFAFSPLKGMSDRQVSEMYKGVNIKMPLGLLDSDVNFATDDVNDGVNGISLICKDGLWDISEYYWYQGSDERIAGTIRVSLNEDNSFTIDMTDVIFTDGTKLSLHYEGTITEMAYDEWSDFGIAALVTVDEGTIRTEKGWVGTRYEEIENGVMISKLFGMLWNPYFDYMIDFIDPQGRKFVEGTYDGWEDYPYTTFCYDGMMYQQYFLPRGNGQITLEKTETTYTIMLDEVSVSNQQMYSKTISVDVLAPLP